MGTKTIIFAVLTFSLMNATTASAEDDLSWLNSANDCESFSSGVVKFQHALSLKGSLSEMDRSNLKLILKEACNERFSSCGFTFCTNQTSGAAESPAAAPDEAASTVRRAQLRPAIVTDPLAWLDQPLQCEELVDQIKARYAPLGGYAQLPTVKKDELAKVLDLACSDRFAHCRFPSCPQNTASSKNSHSVKTSDAKSGRARLATSAAAVDTLVDPSAARTAVLKAEVDAQTSAQCASFEQLYAEKTRERRIQIERAVAEEKAKGVAWKIFSIPGEIESRMGAESDDDGEATKKNSVKPASAPGVSYAAVDDDVSQAAIARQASRPSRLTTSAMNTRPSAPATTLYRAGSGEGYEKTRAPAGRVAPQRMF